MILFFVGRCKAKDLVKEITFAWYGIGDIWVLDDTDAGILYCN